MNSSDSQIFILWSVTLLALLQWTLLGVVVLWLADCGPFKWQPLAWLAGLTLACWFAAWAVERDEQ